VNQDKPCVDRWFQLFVGQKGLVKQGPDGSRVVGLVRPRFPEL